MPRPKKPDMAFEPHHDYFKDALVLSKSEKQPAVDDKIQQTSQSRQSRRVHLDTRFIAALKFAAEINPGRLQALPPEVLLRIITKFLDPPDAVTFALTSHLFMEIVPWALQTPFGEICPPDVSGKTIFSEVLNSCRFRYSNTKFDHARLFRQNLRDTFGPFYIYCGVKNHPVMRSIIPSKDFIQSSGEHKDCCCLFSLFERWDQLLRPAKVGWEIQNPKGVLKVVEKAMVVYLNEKHSRFTQMFES